MDNETAVHICGQSLCGHVTQVSIGNSAVGKQCGVSFPVCGPQCCAPPEPVDPDSPEHETTHDAACTRKSRSSILEEEMNVSIANLREAAIVNEVRKLKLAEKQGLVTSDDEYISVATDDTNDEHKTSGPDLAATSDDMIIQGDMAASEFEDVLTAEVTSLYIPPL